jgi:hypothetical protein
MERGAERLQCDTHATGTVARGLPPDVRDLLPAASALASGVLYPPSGAGPWTASSAPTMAARDPAASAVSATAQPFEGVHGSGGGERTGGSRLQPGLGRNTPDGDRCGGSSRQGVATAAPEIERAPLVRRAVTRSRQSDAGEQAGNESELRSDVRILIQ